MDTTQEVLDAAAIDTNVVAQIFRDAYMEASIESDQVTIDDVYLVFINFDEGHRFLRFSVFMKCREGATPEMKMKYADHANNGYVVVRICPLQTAICYDYYLVIEGGVTKRNIVLSFKRFISCVQAVIRDKAFEVV